MDSRNAYGAIGPNAAGIVVPCHRVIGAGGGPTGFVPGIDLERRLLDHERLAPAKP